MRIFTKKQLQSWEKEYIKRNTEDIHCVDYSGYTAKFHNADTLEVVTFPHEHLFS